MKVEVLDNGESFPLGKAQYDEIVIGFGFVQCFRNGSCYATYALEIFDENSTQSLTIKDQE